jgi:hypothetical protein
MELLKRKWRYWLLKSELYCTPLQNPRFFESPLQDLPVPVVGPAGIDLEMPSIFPMPYTADTSSHRRLRQAGGTDPEQFAVLASLAGVLVKPFNWRLSPGLRRDGRHVLVYGDNPGPSEYIAVPAWTMTAPILDERLVLYGHRDPDETTSYPDFEKRNIQVIAGSLRTV